MQGQKPIILMQVLCRKESYLGGGSPPVWLLFPLGRSGCKYLLVRTGKRRKRKEETKGALREHVSKMNGHELCGCLNHPTPVYIVTPTPHPLFVSQKNKKLCIRGETTSSNHTSRTQCSHKHQTVVFSHQSFHCFSLLLPCNIFYLSRVLCTPLWHICTQIYCDMYTSTGRDGVVGKATCFGLDGIGFEPRQWFDFPHPSRTTPRTTQPLVRCVSGVFPSGNAGGAWR